MVVKAAAVVAVAAVPITAAVIGRDRERAVAHNYSRGEESQPTLDAMPGPPTQEPGAP